MHLVSSNLYSSKYVFHGKAISKEDFETIKEKNIKLYNLMMTQGTNGYCYYTCFSLLKCLEKGILLFVAVKYLEDEKEENHNKAYTMHVLYVNDGWCFNTYGQRQYPLEETLKRMQAKIYTSFTHDDIDGKTYDQFKAEHVEALKIWCEANDCYQEWGK